MRKFFMSKAEKEEIRYAEEIDQMVMKIELCGREFPWRKFTYRLKKMIENVPELRKIIIKSSIQLCIDRLEADEKLPWGLDD